MYMASFIALFKVLVLFPHYGEIYCISIGMYWHILAYIVNTKIPS